MNTLRIAAIFVAVGSALFFLLHVDCPWNDVYWSVLAFVAAIWTISLSIPVGGRNS